MLSELGLEDSLPRLSSEFIAPWDEHEMVALRIDRTASLSLAISDSGITGQHPGTMGYAISTSTDGS